MAVTIKRLGDSAWDVTRHCTSQAEAMAAARALDSIIPHAFAPAIALADGEPATGGSHATHYVEPGPDLPPEAEALQERAMADDPQVGALKAGEAG